MIWVGGVWLLCVLGAIWYVDREINHNFDNEMIESLAPDVRLRGHELDRAGEQPRAPSPPAAARDASRSSTTTR